MNTTNKYYTEPIKYFTVTENDINNNNTLLPNVLFGELEDFVKNINEIKDFTSIAAPHLYKLQLLKNAYLNDKLLIKSQIIKFNDTELQLLATVTTNASSTDSTICKAVYRISFTTNVQKAS